MEEWTQGNEKVRPRRDDRQGRTCGSAPIRRAEGGQQGARSYGSLDISERHRHRYEVNASYIAKLEKGPVILRACRRDGKLPEIFDCADTPGSRVQFHPETEVAGPFQPHPLFASFIGAA